MVRLLESMTGVSIFASCARRVNLRRAACAGTTAITAENASCIALVRLLTRHKMYLILKRVESFPHAPR